MSKKEKKIAVLVVAAGGSKRLGQPKQLVRKNNLTLLENSLNEIVKSRVGNVFLVLGANAELILDKLNLSDYQVVINKNWKKGMGASIAFGMKKIMEDYNYAGVIISVADQPFLTADIFKKIKENITKEKKMIIKSKYEEGSGPPVYFSRHFFEEMKNLSGDEGAKPLLKKYKELLVSIDFPQGNIDIDTEEDLNYWI